MQNHIFRKWEFTIEPNLNWMSFRGIIWKIEKSTEWIDLLMIVEKGNGYSRLYLYPKFFNENIRNQHCSIPSAKKIGWKLNEKIVYSSRHERWVFSSEYRNSFYYCNFKTAFRNFQFCRLPFGICKAPISNINKNRTR